MDSKKKNEELENILNEYKNKHHSEKMAENHIDIINNIEKYEIPDRKTPFEKNEEIKKREDMAKQLKTKNKTRINFFVAIVILCITVFCAYAGFKIFSDISGFGQKDNLITVNIDEGSTTANIANTLENAGVIENSLIFRLHAKRAGVSEKLNFGEFELNSNMSYDKITEILMQPAVRKDIITINFFEGMTQREIAERLEKNNVCTASEFLDALNNHSYDYKFLNSIKPNPDKFNKYEGYLFPDTYQFYLNEEPMDIVNRFFTNFENRIGKDIEEKAREKGMTLDEVITLASIVQAEAGSPENMYDVAGVLLNRLNSDYFPNLECDVTIFYVRENIKPYLSDPESEEELDRWYDVYSTYLCKGLPAGPIGNPGLDAIDAVLNPTEHDYYFFVTDESGKYYYSKTANEHYKNVAAAARVNAELKNTTQG